MTNLSLEQRQLCDIQGRLFINSISKGLSSPEFIKAFMTSHVAKHMDEPFDFYQWAGEEYLLEALEEEAHGLTKGEPVFSREPMYWIGYVYRYWHYYTGQTSKTIYQMIDGQTMYNCWFGFHTLDVEMAIDNLIELSMSRQK